MQRILIIEDDTTIRNGIQLYLQKKEFAVDCADTIAAANALLAKVVSSNSVGYSIARRQRSGTLQQTARN